MEIRPGHASFGESSEDWPLIPSLLLEAAPNGWLIVDLDGYIVMVNQHIEELFGYKRNELIGSQVETLVPDALREQHQVHRHAYAKHMTARPMGKGLHLVGKRKDGSVFPIEVGLSPVHTPAGDYVIAVLQDVTDRLRLEDERNQLAVELEMERERQRIGMDLHDGVMQEIYAAGLTLEIALEDLGPGSVAVAVGIERAIEQLHKVIRNIRSYIFDLRPREFTGSLSEALAELTQEFRRDSLINTKINIQTNGAELNEDRAIALYHIAHEALSNIHKHAQPKNVQISLTRVDGRLRLEIVDDGRGFDAGLALPQQHRGMRNMSSRARAIGGFMEVHSEPGQGTTV